MYETIFEFIASVFVVWYVILCDLKTNSGNMIFKGLRFDDNL